MFTVNMKYLIIIIQGVCFYYYWFSKTLRKSGNLASLNNFFSLWSCTVYGEKDT